MERYDHKQIEKKWQDFWEKDKTFRAEDFSPKPKFLLGLGGGVCDVYQPVERKLKLTRRLLKVIRDFNFPVWILTKSCRVLQDLDLLH